MAYRMSEQILKTLDRDGRAPTTRLASADDAQRLISLLLDRNITRSQINAKVLGAIDGNAPWSQAQLESEGLGMVSNVNFRQLEGDVNAAMKPYYMLYADVPQYVCVRVNTPGYNASEWLRQGQIIDEELTALLDDWDGFDFNMQLAIRNMTTIGLGFPYFSNKDDFRFHTAPHGTVYVDDETTQELGKLGMLFFYYEWSLTEIYDEISKEGAEEAGWDVAACKKILIDSCNHYSGFNRARSWEYWQDKLRDHDIWFVTIDAKVRTAWGYIKEFNRKITRVLVMADQRALTGKFLFKKVNEFERWEQIGIPFFAEIGNGHWNGVKGLGLKSYNARDMQNRLKNKLADAAMIGSQIILQAKDERALEAFQMAQMGPYQVINQELTLAQTQFGSSLDKPMMVDRMLDTDLRSNVGSLRQKMGDPYSVQPISAEQAGIQASFESQLSLADETRWLRTLDKVYKEIVERIKDKPRKESESYPHEEWEELVAEFHKRCTDRGVPPAAFNHIKSVKAYRSIGRGSEYLKQQQGMQIYQIMNNDPNVPQSARINALRSLLASVSGREALENMWPSATIDLMPLDDASKAQDENSGMLLGVAPIWTPDQNNMAHATTHLQFAAQQLQPVMQGQADPAAYLRYAQVAIPHIEQTLQNMPGDRKKSGGTYQQLFNAYQQFVAETQGIAQRYQQQQEAAAQQQAEQQAMMQEAQQTGQMLDPKSQIEMARIRSDHELGVMKLQGDMQLKGAKTSQQLQTKAAQTTQSLAINDLKTAQELNINARKAAQAPAKQ